MSEQRCAADVGSEAWMWLYPIAVACNSGGIAIMLWYSIKRSTFLFSRISSFVYAFDLPNIVDPPRHSIEKNKSARPDQKNHSVGRKSRKGKERLQERKHIVRHFVKFVKETPFTGGYYHDNRYDDQDLSGRHSFQFSTKTSLAKWSSESRFHASSGSHSSPRFSTVTS
ncbi:hypothetical protein IAG25_39160 [Caballeronia sp. EK]|uniref:hypothetical protein n=1 Tax=Caballeronia sp. EK TaxID=2767469 RepID=UPI0016561C3F|nr:hypothetical protein [Caballeronia sp. EK]MBC8642811.1 hypothetical protein [Caballeronia sp. EK]